MSTRTFRRIKVGIAIVTTIMMAGPVTLTGLSSGNFFFGTKSAAADTLFTISGKVFKADGVTPVDGAGVNVRTTDFSQFFGSGTNPLGEFMVQNVPAGTYVLEANPPWNSQGLTKSDPVTITVSSNLVNQNILLKAASKTVTGTVKKTDGTPVYRANVNAWSNQGQGGGFAQTDANGAFTMYLGGGFYGMGVNPDTSPGAPEPDWIYDGPPKEVSFANDTTAQTATVDFVVTAAKASVFVTVVKTDGTPITTGQVDVRSPDGRGNGRPLQGTNTVTLKVPAGTYFVNYFSQDGRFSASPQSVNAVDNTTVSVTLTAKEKTAHVTGKLTDASGVALPNVMLNLNCEAPGSTGGPGGPGLGSWSNGQSAADGTFDILTTAGRCHLNINQGPESNYIYGGTPLDFDVATDTSIVAAGTIVLTYADAKIVGRLLDESGNVVPNFPGWVFARKAQSTTGGPGQEFGGPVMNGRFEIKLPSSVLSIVTIGIHTPPNVEYSVKTNPTVAVVANSTTTQDLTLVRNTSAIYGALVSTTGIPLSSCVPPAGARFFGEVFAFNPERGDGRNTFIKEDCTYEMSVGAGTYQIGWHFDDRAGFLNRPPSPDPTVVGANQRVVKNITVAVGDAKITGVILDPTGKPVPNVFVGADNHEELFGGPGGPGGPGKPGEGPKGIEDKRGPGGKETPEEVMKYCTNPKNKVECEKEKLPPGAKGPGGCTNAYNCSQFCSKPANKEECGRFFQSISGPGGPGPGEFTGPGGCKTETECKTFCSKPENQQECSKFAPPEGQMSGAAFTTGRVKGASTGEERFGPKPEDFEKQIFGGSQTDPSGKFSITILSGHKYSIHTGLPPDSAYMPAPQQTCDLTKSKSCTLTLILRTSDAKITGKVTLGSTGGAKLGFVHAWSERGNFSGAQIINGAYTLNVSSGDTWHVGADSPNGRDFFRAEEVIVVIDKAGTYTQNFSLSKNFIQLPPPVSTSFDATQPQAITLEDGTTITIPAGALASSGNVMVTATPTVNVNSQKTNQPAFGFGYEIKAFDSNNVEITKFAAATVSVKYVYKDSDLEKLGIEESALVPKYYDESSGTWKSPDNVTQDTERNTITVINLDHFSKHALVSTSGGSASKTKLTSVTTKKTKTGETQLTIGSGRTIIPFKGYTGELSVVTANLGGTSGQVVAVAPAGDTKDTAKVLVYTAKVSKGKTPAVKKTLVPFGGYKKGLTLSLQDVTQDGKEELLVSTVNGGGEARVYNIVKKYKEYGFDVGAARFKGNTVASSLEAYTKGQGALVLKAGDDLNVYKYNKTKDRFTEDIAYNVAKKLTVSGDTVTVNILRPKVTSTETVTYSSSATKTVKVTVDGENFTKDTIVRVQGLIGVTVKYKSGTTLELTITPSKFKKGKSYSFMASNTEGTASGGKLVVK